VDAVSSGRGKLGLANVSLSPSVPVVAVGGPVRVYYEEVGKRLGCEMIFPPFFDVANAVGAATGVVAQVVTVSVEGDGSGLFRVLGPKGASVFTSGPQALVAADEQARALALEGVRQMGATDAQVQVSITKSHLPDALDDNGLLEAKIRAEAIGRPETGQR
jgi:N-methylhydantoinase A/oxoprolinase/acetone carboxylase beta subunit